LVQNLVTLVRNANTCIHFFAVPRKCDEPWAKSFQPACDTSGRQHRNLCSLANAGALLAYKGPCLRTGCSNEGLICGADGITHISECAAEAQGIPKDYEGPCQFIGTSDGSTLQPSCKSRVKCLPLPKNCIGVTPSGACCPICGGVLRVIYSPTQVSSNSRNLNSSRFKWANYNMTSGFIRFQDSPTQQIPSSWLLMTLPPSWVPLYRRPSAGLGSTWVLERSSWSSSRRSRDHGQRHSSKLVSVRLTVSQRSFPNRVQSCRYALHCQ
jgi:hypothetical protein